MNTMMRGRETKGPPSTDLLVCFPTRAHLTLMPKSICSPARPSDPNKRHHPPHHHLKKLSNRGGGRGGGQASPLLWSKTKPMGPDISEPTSPKVTCAGQIKVRPKTSCKNWQSVMEEIEKLHNDREQKKRSSNWIEALGFKKDTMQFLTCLRRIRFDFRCFGSFPSSELSSDDEEDDEEDGVDRENKVVGVEKTDENENSATVFSKWFMVLHQEKNSSSTFTPEQRKQRKQNEEYSDKEEPIIAQCGPPPNALLLMRCRSAPAKSWLEEREEEDEDEDEDEDEEREYEEETKKKLNMEEDKKNRSLAMVMRCDTDFNNFSSDIAKETWVVGGLRAAISRSQSWKR